MTEAKLIDFLFKSSHFCSAVLSSYLGTALHSFSLTHIVFFYIVCLSGTLTLQVRKWIGEGFLQLEVK